MQPDVRGLAPLLQVFDMPAALHFYRDGLGFEVVGSSGQDDHAGWVLLLRQGVELMLNTAYEADSRPPAPDPARVASHSDVTLYFGCPDPEAVHAHLASHGIRTEPPKVAPYGMKQLYVTDPDGYVLCFQWPASEATRADSRKRYGVG